MPILSIILLFIIGIILFGSGIWIIFFSNSLRTSSDLSRVLIFGWIGAAVLRSFFKPRENTWIGWQKNVLGGFFIVASLIIFGVLFKIV